MIKKFSVLALFLITTFNFSQEVKNYTWDIKPSFDVIPEGYKDQPAVFLLDKRWIHTRIGGYSFASFVMNHCAIKINKAEEINKYNKVKAEDNGYIRNLRDFHARIIKSNGEIKVLPQNKIIEAEIDKVKSIVFEGVEVGDILEYYFILKESPSAYGVEIFQKDIPVLHAELITSYEGVNFETFVSDVFSANYKDKKKSFVAKNIPPFTEEKNAKNVKNLIKIIYNINVFGAIDNFDWSSFLPFNFKKPSFNYFKKKSS